MVEELHIFVDAAETSGYGAAAYRRIVSEEGTVKVVLLTSRSHVVPLNPARASHHNSTPRLELSSAVKGVELRQFVIRATESEFSRIVMWSDSEAALKMINDTTTRFRLFFANRLSKIHASSNAKEWRHVDSEQNPADFCSRGTKADEEAKWKIFHFGPNFLYHPKANGHKPTSVANKQRIFVLSPWTRYRNLLSFFKTLLPKLLHGFGSFDASPSFDNAHVDGKQRQKQRQEKPVPIFHEWTQLNEEVSRRRRKT